MLKNFLEDLDLNDCHVRAPKRIVLVCGGPVGEGGSDLRSMRDAFYRIPINPYLGGAEPIQAEELTREYTANIAQTYNDILRFESDFAQICALVILFCESEGSLAELGAFALDEEISKKIFVVIRSSYYTDDSFIKLGPLKRIEEIDPQAVFAVDDDDIGLDSAICSHRKPHLINKGIDVGSLKELIGPSIAEKMEKCNDPTTLNTTRNGHFIKVLVGLIQEFGCLTLEEINNSMKQLFDLDDRPVKQLILCATSARWIQEHRKGNRVFYFNSNDLEDDAVNFRFKEGSGIEKKNLRRRASIMEHWREHDVNRHRSITAHRGK